MCEGKAGEGILYGIGVGPGDPELLTLKAVRTIRACDVIMAPGEDCRCSIAYRIAVQAVPELAKKECAGARLPMTRDPQVLKSCHKKVADVVEGYLRQGKSVGFLNLGDVTIYASYFHILAQPEQIPEGLKLPGTKVIMKMGKNIGQVKAWLKEAGLEAAMVENCGMDGERVCLSVDELDETAGYYSLLVVKGPNHAGHKRPEE